jgi:parvulin-like peptidyl-prolyl isomerase
MKRRVPGSLSVVVLAMTMSACREGAPPAGPKTPSVGVVATVNGQPITEAELKLRLKPDQRGEALSPEWRKNLLEAAVVEEAAAQKAEQAGYDQDPDYQQKLSELMAQVRALRRSALSSTYFQKEVAQRVAVSDAEVSAYFEANKAQLQTQYHVLQILRRTEGEANEVLQAIKGGQAFEEAAQQGLPPSVLASRPWDMGFLSFEQLPEAWRTVVGTLKPGEVSGVIKGPAARAWVIELLEQRSDPTITLDAVKAGLTETLKARKLLDTRSKLEASLRAEAKVVVTP